MKTLDVYTNSTLDLLITFLAMHTVRVMTKEKAFEALELWAHSQTDRQIAEAVGASYSVVRRRIAYAVELLGATNRANAVAIAVRDGHIEVRSPK